MNYVCVMQCFVLAHAMLCVGKCKALRGRMQSFALALAMLCVSERKALRGQMQCFASDMG